jgi:hypothetical protein
MTGKALSKQRPTLERPPGRRTVDHIPPWYWGGGKSSQLVCYRRLTIPSWGGLHARWVRRRGRRGCGGGQGMVLEESEDDNDVPVTVDDADEEDQVDDLA